MSEADARRRMNDLHINNSFANTVGRRFWYTEYHNLQLSETDNNMLFIDKILRNIETAGYALDYMILDLFDGIFNVVRRSEGDILEFVYAPVVRPFSHNLSLSISFYR